MIRVWKKVIVVLLVVSLTGSQIRPIASYVKTIGVVALGALALMNPVGWCFKRCKRCLRPLQERVHQSLTRCSRFLTFCKPEEESEEELAISRHMLAHNARKWCVKSILILVPIMLSEHSHMFLHKEISNSTFDTIIVCISLYISSQVEKNEQRYGPQSIPAIFVKSLVIGGLTVVMVKLETELFFIIEPYAWWGAVATLVVTAGVAKPVVSLAAKLTTKMTNGIRDACSYVFAGMKRCCSRCCCCCRRGSGSDDEEKIVNGEEVGVRVVFEEEGDEDGAPA